MARQQNESVLLYDGVSAPTIEVQEGSGATYYIGDLVEFDTSGQIKIAVAGNIAGIACMDKTGTAGSVSDVQFMELINFQALYLMTAASGATPAQTEIGENFAITFDVGSTAALGHTIAEGSGDVWVYGIYPGDVTAAGVVTAGGRYIVRFNAKTIEPAAA